LTPIVKKTGYEKALPQIEFWIKHKNSNIARAVTEGLRIWTGRDFFRENPEIAIALISLNKWTESLYLRKSIGNALRDIKKKFPEKIKKEISKWDKQDNKIAFIVQLINK
jgi:3-methyladenine DNA glycosylase AlkC